MLDIQEKNSTWLLIIMMNFIKRNYFKATFELMSLFSVCVLKEEKVESIKR